MCAKEQIKILRFMAQKYGFQIYQSDLKASENWGYCDPMKQIIVIHNKLDIKLAVFVLAHELGHAMSFVNEPIRYIESKLSRNFKDWFAEEQRAWATADKILEVLTDSTEEYSVYEIFKYSCLKAAERSFEKKEKEKEKSDATDPNCQSPD